MGQHSNSSILTLTRVSVRVLPVVPQAAAELYRDNEQIAKAAATLMAGAKYVAIVVPCLVRAAFYLLNCALAFSFFFFFSLFFFFLFFFLLLFFSFLMT